LYNTYASSGLLTVTFVYENAAGQPSTQADAAQWANTYQQDGIVAFAANSDDFWYPYGVDQGGGSFSIELPGIMLVGAMNEVVKIGFPSTAEIEAALP
jgi:hypothetical protein